MIPRTVDEAGGDFDPRFWATFASRGPQDRPEKPWALFDPPLGDDGKPVPACSLWCPGGSAATCCRTRARLVFVVPAATNAPRPDLTWCLLKRVVEGVRHLLAPGALRRLFRRPGRPTTKENLR